MLLKTNVGIQKMPLKKRHLLLMKNKLPLLLSFMLAGGRQPWAETSANSILPSVNNI